MASEPRGERGVALVATLMVTTLLSTLGAGLAFMIVTETLISANYRRARETLYAADAGLERAMADLRTIADWTAVILPMPAQVRSSFDDGRAMPVAPDGAVLDLARMTATLQSSTNASYAGPPADVPVWRVFAQSNLGGVIPGETPALAYVVVWVADDPADNDGDPERDANGTLLVRSEAFGPAGAHRIVDAAVAKAPEIAGGVGPLGVRLVSWRLGR